MNKTSFQQVGDEVESHFVQIAHTLSQRDSILKYNIQQLFLPMYKYIVHFNGVREELHKACERHIVRILETHRLFFNMHRKQQCDNMQVHMMLYVAARVAYLCGLPNSPVVVRLLSEIYRCDHSFENLLMGAYYEPELCPMMAQAQSVYSSLDEGLSAFRYFLHHTNLEKKLFIKDGCAKRMADLPLIKSCLGQPASYAIATKCTRTFKLLVEHGADLDDSTEPTSSYKLLEMLQFVAPEYNTPEVKYCRKIFDREHPEVLPMKEQTLMMLARKVIRRHLNISFQLPMGIEALPIPQKLKRYLHLDYD